MNDWLTVIALHVVTVIHVMALLIVAFGTVQAFVRSIRAMFDPSPTGRHFHGGYIQYARWLVAGLTFQLAADIIETAFSPSWDEIGRLAAISVIRTFVNYFLERDLAEEEKREASSQRAAPALRESAHLPPTSPRDA
jgi:uncharacterized membrane protein